MTRLFCLLLTLLFSLSGPVMGGYSDFGQSSLAAKSEGVFHVTPEGVVMPPGKDFNLVPTVNGKKGDFIQIHQNHDHENLNAKSGVGAHTHKPEVNTSSSGASSIKRVDSATTADDVNQVDAALKNGTMRERTGRKNRGDL